MIRITLEDLAVSPLRPPQEEVVRAVKLAILGQDRMLVVARSVAWGQCSSKQQQTGQLSRYVPGF